MSPKARPAFSAALSHRRPPRGTDFFQAFPFFLGGFMGFQRVREQKNWRPGFSGFAKSCLAPRGKFSRKKPLPPVAGRRGGRTRGARRVE